MEDAEEKGDASDGKASESSSEAAADDAEDDNEAPDMELREKIEDALRASGIEAATGETGDLDEDEEEDLMDDEQMLAIDEQLAEVFRSRANEKKGGKGTLSSIPSKLSRAKGYQTPMPNGKLRISRIESLT